MKVTYKERTFIDKYRCIDREDSLILNGKLVD